MANKPRMGSDPFQKKDPLGWIGGDSADGTDRSEGVGTHPSEPEQPSKQGKRSPLGPPSKTGNPSKHDLPSPLSGSGKPEVPGAPQRGITTSKGLRPGWTRATFIVREETVRELKAVAYWDRKELKKVVEEAFRAYLTNKPSRPVPEDAAD